MKPKNDQSEAPAFKTSIEVSARRVADLLCCAREGGSNYWYLIVDHSGYSRFLSELPLYPFGWLEIVDNEDQEDQEDQKGPRHRLDRKALEKGLAVMAEKYPKHYGDFIAENDDSITGDVFLQCCLFGEVIYG